jgi:hypothetical protein
LGIKKATSGDVAKRCLDLRKLQDHIDLMS